MERQTGAQGAFLVQILGRQNATWQGTVVWAEKNQKASFRSALELIKLMDSAVEESLPDPGSPQEPSEENHDSFVQE